MKIPRKMKVGAHNIRVEICDLGDDLDGDFDNEKLRLRLNERLPQSMLEATFFHELFHALNPQFDLDPMAHMMLEGFAEQLYQVLADNQLLR